jgi:hypothetical protein
MTGMSSRRFRIVLRVDRWVIQGRHDDTEEKKGDEFYKSSTVANAANAIKKGEQAGIVIKNIEDFNKGNTPLTQNSK